MDAVDHDMAAAKALTEEIIVLKKVSLANLAHRVFSILNIPIHNNYCVPVTVWAS